MQLSTRLDLVAVEEQLKPLPRVPLHDHVHESGLCQLADDHRMREIRRILCLSLELNFVVPWRLILHSVQLRARNLERDCDLLRNDLRCERGRSSAQSDRGRLGTPLPLRRLVRRERRRRRRRTRGRCAVSLVIFLGCRRLRRWIQGGKEEVVGEGRTEHQVQIGQPVLLEALPKEVFSAGRHGVRQRPLEVAASKDPVLLPLVQNTLTGRSEPAPGARGLGVERQRAQLGADLAADAVDLPHLVQGADVRPQLANQKLLEERHASDGLRHVASIVLQTPPRDVHHVPEHQRTPQRRLLRGSLGLLDFPQDAESHRPLEQLVRGLWLSHVLDREAVHLVKLVLLLEINGLCPTSNFDLHHCPIRSKDRRVKHQADRTLVCQGVHYKLEAVRLLCLFVFSCLAVILSPSEQVTFATNTVDRR
mmetsp:Transcript_43292/g.139114  ORF Transcript_43292/g.139114 Transcript_43292/m.139114 type:complete len:421 (+) Transcript_43292:1035-2297(+)